MSASYVEGPCIFGLLSASLQGGTVIRTFKLQIGLLCWMTLQWARHAIPLVTGGVVTTWHNLQLPVSNLCWDLIEVGWVTVGLAYWLLPT